MKTYKIKYEPITIEGKNVDKYNIYYYEDGKEISKEFHSKDGINGDIKEGFEKEIDKENIGAYKDFLFELIDKKTQKNYSKGFDFDSKKFRIENNDQLYISEIKNLPNTAFPIKLFTKNNNIYTLTIAQKDAFYNTYLAYKNTLIQSEMTLKESVLNENKLNKLKNIEDSL